MKSSVKFLSIFLTCAVLSLQGQAWAGDGTGNGGSPMTLRMRMIREFINNELRASALRSEERRVGKECRL